MRARSTSNPQKRKPAMAKGSSCVLCCRLKRKCDIGNPCSKYHGFILLRVCPPHILFSCQSHGLADKCQRVTTKARMWARNSLKGNARSSVNVTKSMSPKLCVATAELWEETSDVLQVRSSFGTKLTSLSFVLYFFPQSICVCTHSMKASLHALKVWLSGPLFILHGRLFALRYQ